MKVVYSSERGRICPGCGHPVAACVCSERDSAAAPGDGIVRVSRETKGRKGKGVVVVRGLPLRGEALAGLARRLKKRCGAGGTVKEGAIEIQGDHLDRVIEALRSFGWTVR